MPFYKTSGVVSWQEEIRNGMPEDEANWKKCRRQTLAQMEPFQWMKDATEGPRRILSIRKRFIVDAVGMLECAHRPQRFQKRRGLSFADSGAAKVRLCKALPLSVLAPP